MKGKQKYIIHFLIMFVVFMLQCSPLKYKISVLGVWPNAFFSLIFVCCIYFKNKEVFLYAILFGSLNDIIFGDIYGINTILLMIFVCMFFVLNKFIYNESAFTVFIYGLVSSFLYEGIFMIINLSQYKDNSVINELFLRLTVKSIYDAVLILLIYVIARHIHRKRQEARTL